MNHLPPFLVIADQAHLKAYFADESKSNLRLVDDMEFPPAEEPVGRSAAVPPPGSAGVEDPNLPRMATRISQLLQEQKPDHWGFAAPADLNERILNLLDDTLRRGLTCNVREDLTKVPADKLSAHFVQGNVSSNTVKAAAPGPGDSI